nr:hypothetical protein CFP56_35004 [Quercus suber]
METKSNEDWMVMVRDKCGFKHGLFVASNGSSDGLAMLWKETVKLDMQNFFMSHIDAWVDGGPGVGWWHLTGFYGKPETRRRPESWAKLKHLRTTSSLPWLVIRDFKELMGMSEKERGGNKPRQQMANFVEAVNWCGLRDIGFIGPKFTWFYERSDGSQIRERLDRALATFDWVNLFPMARLHHLTSLASDHSPLVLHFVGKTNAKKPKKLFRFESMWLKEPRCEEVVMEAWSEGLASSTNFPLVACLNACRSRLDAWNKAEFGHIMMSDFHDDKDAKLVVTLASALWYNRNEVRHGKKKKSAMALVQWSRQYLRESQAANQVVSSPVVPRVLGDRNLDDAVFLNGRRISYLILEQNPD